MPSPQASDPKPPYNAFLRYSGFAFQLLGGISAAGWLGYQLDRYFGLGFPAFMLLFMVLALSGMLYQVYRRFNEE